MRILKKSSHRAVTRGQTIFELEKNKIGISLDDCYRNRGMIKSISSYSCLTRVSSIIKWILGTSPRMTIGLIFLTSMSMTGIVRAECVPSPNCAEIGYTATSCTGDSLKCPFDTSKLFCIPCDSSYQYTCTQIGQKGKGTSCDEKYIECECNEGYEWNGTACTLVCASTYKYTCNGTGYNGGSGAACGGKYTSCTCSSGYEWSGTACTACGSSYKYTCNGTDNWGNGTACGGKYTSCSCPCGYSWDSVSGICVRDSSDSTCTVGKIYYSDKTCSCSVVSGKTAIGVVIKENMLVISKERESISWSSEVVDIDGLTNYASETNAKADYNGKSNTDIIIAGDSEAIAAKYCNDYTTTGTSAGEWYLPAAGELYSYVGSNYNIISNTMEEILGWRFGHYYFWSSSEQDFYSAWMVGGSSTRMDFSPKSYTRSVSCFLEIG